MPDFDIAPKSTEHFLPTEPEEQKIAKSKERGALADALPLINDIITRLEQRIEFYTSIDSVPKEVQVKPDEFMHVVASNKLTRDNLVAEKTTLEALIDAHLK